MPEYIKAASWNALNLFGDERASDGLEVVKRLDADVLYLPEFTRCEERGSEESLTVQERLTQELGYTVGVTSDYSPYPEVRNAHTMSVWSRVGGTAEREAFGQRWGLGLWLPESDMRVRGLHLDDTDEALRYESADALVAHLDRLTIGETAIGEVVMGDLNAMHRSDRRAQLLSSLRWVDSEG